MSLIIYNNPQWWPEGKTPFYLQPQGKLATPEGKSLLDVLELHVAELIEGHLYRKDDFIDVEDDTDYIDDYVDETPYDKMLTEAMKNGTQSETAPSSSSRHQTEKINAILASVDISR